MYQKFSEQNFNILNEKYMYANSISHFFSGDFKNITVCENQQINIRCERSQRIAIYSVLFGRATTNTPKCLKNGIGYAGNYPYFLSTKSHKSYIFLHLNKNKPTLRSKIN